MATEQMPTTAHEDAPVMMVEDSSPTPPPVAEHEPPEAAQSVAHPTVKTEEAVDPPHKLHPESEATSGSSSSMLTNTGDGGSKSRDEALAKVNQDKNHSHIRAWEENMKAKSLNKHNRQMAKITAWENTKKASAEAKLRKAEEKLEKKRAAYVEKMKNETAAAHRQAEEKRAIADAKKGEEHLQAEEMAAKYKTSGQVPKKFLCFGA